MRLTGRVQSIFWGILLSLVVVGVAQAATSPKVVSNSVNTTDAFGLQVSPSPIIEALSPGQQQTVDLTIRNLNDHPENLKFSLRTFSVSGVTTKIHVSNNPAPASIASLVSFAQPTFTVGPYATNIEQMTFSPSVNAAFSYSFVILISRQQPIAAGSGQTKIEGSVAIFSLLNIIRPVATQSFALSSFSATQGVYEYLPATFQVDIKNTGNTNVAPTGNIFIQRTETGSPLAVLALNPNDSYLLPNTTRQLSVSWSDGFPHYVSYSVADNVASKQKLDWSWSGAPHIRYGRYVAHVIAVYFNGTRDVPLDSDISFWVIPWKAVAIIVVIIGLMGVGTYSTVRKTVKFAKRHHKHD